MRKGFLYLVAIMDWFTRKVLAWRISNTLEAEFCLEALNEAIHRFGAPGIMNTDQGSQFTSFDWTDRLKRARTKISMDGKARYLDNPRAFTRTNGVHALDMSRLWRSLKYECADLHAWETGSQAKAGVGRWITFHGQKGRGPKPWPALGKASTCRCWNAFTRHWARHRRRCGQPLGTGPEHDVLGFACDLFSVIANECQKFRQVQSVHADQNRNFGFDRHDDGLAQPATCGLLLAEFVHDQQVCPGNAAFNRKGQGFDGARVKATALRKRSERLADAARRAVGQNPHIHVAGMGVRGGRQNPDGACKPEAAGCKVSHRLRQTVIDQAAAGTGHASDCHARCSRTEDPGQANCPGSSVRSQLHFP